jgi:enoyl-CoA hydratase/carnithine racemase
VADSIKTESRRKALVGQERQGAVVRLTISNPPANVLSLDLIQSLQERLDEARDDENVRVIILAAAGALFSAGHDLKEMTSRRADPDGGRSYFERVFALCSELMQSIVRLPKPVIVEIDGIATAAGCQLVATCDLAIASDRSKFGVNGIDVGLFCSTPAVALTRNIGTKRAMQMLLTGEMIDAETALEFGLVNRIVAKEALTKVVNECARIISAKSPVALRLGKAAVYEQSGLDLEHAYQHASRVMVENMLAADAKEGIAAFFEKRPPIWRAN